MTKKAKKRKARPAKRDASSFLPALAKRKTRDAAVDRLLASLAESIAPELATFLDWYATTKASEIGLWRIATGVEMRAPSDATTPLDRAALAAATGTLFLGTDGSGARFYVEQHPSRAEVFIFDPGAGQLAFLADSLRAFVELNELVSAFDDFCEKHDVDADPEEIEEIDTSLPGFKDLRARALALKGHVNLNTRSDYDETIEALAKTKLRAKPSAGSTVIASYKKAKRAAKA